MKPLFGVAVFGLLPVPPMPPCDALAGSTDDRPAAAEDLKQRLFEPHANDNEQDKPAPDPVEEGDAESPQNGDAADAPATRLPPNAWLPHPKNAP